MNYALQIGLYLNIPRSSIINIYTYFLLHLCYGFKHKMLSAIYDLAPLLMTNDPYQYAGKQFIFETRQKSLPKMLKKFTDFFS